MWKTSMILPSLTPSKASFREIDVVVCGVQALSQPAWVKTWVCKTLVPSILNSLRIGIPPPPPGPIHANGRPKVKPVFGGPER